MTMTREEQIFNIAAQFAIDETGGQNTGKAASMRGLIFSAFKAGAQWADQHPQWIPVEEELPKEKGKYMFRLSNGDMCYETYYPKLKLVANVTHWMPIVPPRKEDKMSETNQVCVTCTQRDTCQYYDPNRTICVPVKESDYGQFAGSLQPTIDWQHYRIKAAIAAMQGMLANPAYQKVQVESGEPFGYFYAMNAIMCADVLIEELQKKGGQDDG